MDIFHGRGPLIQIMLGLSFITLIVKSLLNFSLRLENLSAIIVPHSQSLQYFAESRSKEIPQAARRTHETPDVKLVADLCNGTLTLKSRDLSLLYGDPFDDHVDLPPVANEFYNERCLYDLSQRKIWC